MNYSYTFNLKDPNSTKPTLIYLRARIKAENKYLKYSTGEKIEPKNWDKELQFPKKIKGRTTKAIQVNSIINQLSRYGEAFQLICSKIEAEGTELTVNLIKAELDYQFKKFTTAPKSFFNVFNEFIQEKKDLGKITTGTIGRYENIKSVLEDFSIAEKYNLTFNRINNDFYIKFVKYSRKTLRHKNNTLGRNIGFIKTFMNWAVMKKYHRNLDFKNFEKVSSDTDEVALSFTELEKLYTHKFKTNRLRKVVDVFIFGCSTGMRYSDYSRISKRNIRDGQIFINTTKQKSNLGIPLNKYSKEILEKYDYNLPIISPQKFREYIKEACKVVDFNEDIVKTSFIGNERIEEVIPKYKMISTHTARRTFITLSLEKGMRPDIVMSITGHKSYSSFKKYIKLSKKIREEEMNKAWS
ncbi:tyrosine-type recombinase/integrase [Marixanthomonas sp. SCSIO 43207]|uniref:site-specific integrase n=1 Tax=Marixanthomonas sp. SCSIO 43207 TaxID=2779360 RepID=UPI001CA989FA|nr:site-specific integrase [Marixanthomonas sp. SCSIO 43207]UAB80971.1 tyrosine-type recombinase/integrase [Marixanthomonas sp. SCSIO 43207]